MSNLRKIIYDLLNLADYIEATQTEGLDLFLVLDYGNLSQLDVDVDLRSKKNGLSGGYSFPKLSYAISYQSLSNALTNIFGKPTSVPARWHSETIWVMEPSDFKKHIKQKIEQISLQN